MRNKTGYIRDLRQHVGHMPIIMVGAAVLVINQRSELLMLRRTDNGCWGVPGGAMEPGEHSEMGYFPLHILPQPVSPPIKTILEQLQKRFAIL